MKLVEMMKRFWNEEEGLTMVEYALAGALIAAVAIAGFTTLGTSVSNKADTLATTINNAGT